MDFHFLPGYFATGPEPLLNRLVAGGPGLRVLNWEGSEDDPRAQVDRLRDPAAGEVRKLKGEARIPPGKPLEMEVETFGAPAGRVLAGLRIALPDDPGITLKDLEIVLLGLACAALSGADQGAVLFGNGLGPVGAGAGRGTLAEQVREMLDVHGVGVEVVIAAPGTAASLGEVDGFIRRPLGNAWEYRR